MPDNREAIRAKGEIDLLLEEYRALRAEVTQRVAAG